MRQAFQKHEPQTTDAYVSDLEQQLRRGLPLDKTAEISREVRAHLADRVDDLMAQGLPRAVAEAQAVSGFGTAGHYAHAATQGAYGDRNSARWRLVGRMATANVFGLMACGMLSPLCGTPGIGALVSFFALSALLVPLSAFGSRLPQTRTYAALMSVATLALAVGAGICYVPNKSTPPILLVSPLGQQISMDGLQVSTSRSVSPGMLRGTFDAAPASFAHVRRLHQQEQQLLLLGRATYTQGTPVPAALRQDTRYIVPQSYRKSDNKKAQEMNASAFRQMSFPVYADLYQQPPQEAAPISTVSTYAEAKKLWIERGASWVTHKANAIEYCTEGSLAFKQLQAALFRFNTAAMTFFVSLFLQWSALLLLVDYVMAHLGRAVWISLRNRRRSQAA